MLNNIGKNKIKLDLQNYLKRLLHFQNFILAVKYKH